jgi:hypothetical protein
VKNKNQDLFPLLNQLRPFDLCAQLGINNWFNRIKCIVFFFQFLAHRDSGEIMVPDF